MIYCHAEANILLGILHGGGVCKIVFDVALPVLFKHRKSNDFHLLTPCS